MPAIEPCIYPLSATKTKPAGYRVQKFVTDQWGESRKISEIFRGPKSLEKARAFRERLEREKETGEIFQRFKMDDPRSIISKGKEKPGSVSEEKLLDAHMKVYDEKYGGPEQTLQEFVERGCTTEDYRGQDRIIIDPESEDIGFMRRLIEDTSSSNVSQKRAVWNKVKEQGSIHTKTLAEITGDDVDQFVRWLEGHTKDDGTPHYSKSSIRRYRMALRSMIKGYAAGQRQTNPLDLVPTRKKPSRIKGRSKQRKVPTEKELSCLEKGFLARIVEARDKKGYKDHLARREWAYAVHQVLRGTGMRPSEVLYLETKHIDMLQKQIIVQGAAIDGEGGATKTGKAKGDDNEGVRVVPVDDAVITVITTWLDKRSSLGFPEATGCPVIFCDEVGSYATDDSLRTHYKGSSEEGGLGEDPDHHYVTPYQMRHYRNDYLRRRGVPSELRQAVMGHISEETNLNYTEVKASELRDYLDA